MKRSLWTIAFFTLSVTAIAVTEPKCSDLDAIGGDNKALEACATQADDALNATYEKLVATHKEDKEKQKALKEMQAGWSTMRYSQCLFKSMNSAGNAAQTAMRCEIEMTMSREKELAEM